MQIDVIGVPMDLGAGRRGVDMGPSAIRYARLDPTLRELGYTVRDLGNLDVPPPETTTDPDPRQHFLDPLLTVVDELARRTQASVTAGNTPLVLGGDHSLALGSVRGASQAANIGLLWIDAHGDFNTRDTTISGNIHGMPLAALTGRGDPRLVNLGRAEPPARLINPRHIAVVGVRQLDPGERRLLLEARVHVFPMEQIDRVGLYQVMEEALAITCTSTDGLYLSLDLDALDPLIAPGVGTPVPGGLSYREAHTACEMVAETRRLIGMDIVEVNPILDTANRTAEMAVDLALSAFGKRVWGS